MIAAGSGGSDLDVTSGRRGSTRDGATRRSGMGAWRRRRDRPRRRPRSWSPAPS